MALWVGGGVALLYTVISRCSLFLTRTGDTKPGTETHSQPHLHTYTYTHSLYTSAYTPLGYLESGVQDRTRLHFQCQTSFRLWSVPMACVTNFSSIDLRQVVLQSAEVPEVSEVAMYLEYRDSGRHVLSEVRSYPVGHCPSR